MKLFAVFGNPIAHSKSPYLHNSTFYNLGIDARYVRILMDLTTNAEDFREQFFEYGLSGANITIPFKEIALEACDEVSEIAQKIGAINTIVRRDERLFGYNTDAMGFYRNLIDSAKCVKNANFKNPNSSILSEKSGLRSCEQGDRTNGSSTKRTTSLPDLSPKDEFVKNALIVGAGGSAKAIAFILQERGICVEIINRSENRLEFFRQNGFKSANFAEFSANLSGESQYDLIVNATSSSINGELPLDRAILAGLFKRAKIAFDLMYGKKCPFLEFAKNRRICAIDGTKMLLFQAIEASKIFLESHKSNQIETAMHLAFRRI
ncbi:shikimate dehydrogenase [Helicobacter sp. 23-1044]